MTTRKRLSRSDRRGSTWQTNAKENIHGTVHSLQRLPQGKDLADVVGELNQVLEDGCAVCGGRGRIDLDLEDERVDPKYAQIAVKAYLQRAAFRPGHHRRDRRYGDRDLRVRGLGPCIPT